MNRFLRGGELFDTVFHKKARPSASRLLDGKYFCDPHNSEQLEDALSNLFAHLRQEHVSLDSRIAQGELLKMEETGSDSSYLVRITSARGKFLRKFGFTSDASQCLYPEEAYYLSECGSLQVYDGGLPLSLQQLCNTIFRNSSEFSNYLAYVRLVRQGFVLRRRKTFGSTEQSYEECKQSKIFTLPLNFSSEYNLTELDIGDIPEEFLVASPNAESYSRPDLVEPFAPTSSFHFNNSDLEVFNHLVVFDAFDDRMGNFKKGVSADPVFVLVVLSLNDVCSFLPDKRFRRHFHIPSDTITLVAVVKDGEVYFHSTNAFLIPTIKRVLV